MFYNYLKIAARNLVRHRTFSLLNLVGLTLGTICCLYIVLYVQGHYGFDQHHTEVDKIYRITSELKIAGEGELIKTACSSPPIAPALKADFPEVIATTRVCPPLGVSQQLLRVGEDAFYIDPGYYVDSTFFEVFDFNFVAGNPKTALNEPFTVVISTDLATKLFGDKPALGESVSIGDSEEALPFKVGGVINDDLGSTHLENDLYLSMNSGGWGQFIRNNENWAGNNFLYSYVRLSPQADASALWAKLPAFLEEHGDDQYRTLGMEKKLHLQPLTSIHTSSEWSGDLSGNTSNAFLRLMLLIAGFIQLVACINFMNLTTARASRRAQEVGIRKVVGAERGSLTGQFLVESLLLAVIAVGLAIPITRVVLPYLNELTEADLIIQFDFSMLVLLFGLAIVTGIMAGLYPALYLSGFKPAKVLKGGQFKGKSWVRQTLVIGQMVLASGLIMGAFIIHSQVAYMLEKDLGFEAQQKLVFNLNGVSNGQQITAYRDALLRLPEVRNAAAVNETPGKRMVSDILLYKAGQTMDDGDLTLMSHVDENFLETLKIDLLAGRNFTLADTASTRGVIRVIINEEAIRKQQIPLDEAVGTVLYSDMGYQRFEATIVGVMADINYQSLVDELRPMIMVASPASDLGFLIADVESNDYSTFLAKAKSAWEQMVPELPFRYSFLDNDIAQLYQTEQTLSRIISTFTILAIIIACLGLFGLSVYAAEQRKKEISIRKVLGASVESLVLMLSKEFVLLVGIALLIAVPLAYYFMQQWLANFAFHTPIYWWIFAGTAGIALGLSFLTISFQSIRAALANPVENLKE